MKKYKKDFINLMVRSGVLMFGEFTAKSGRITPYYINAGNYMTGEQLKELGEFYAHSIVHNFGEDIDILFGPAYKGIPLSVATTIALHELYGIDVSYCSNRKEMKDPNNENILLGSGVKNNSKVLFIEDVTTAGTSIHDTMPILNTKANIDVVGLIISVDRMEQGKTEKNALKLLELEYGMKTTSIVTIEEVVEHLYNREIDGTIFINDQMKKDIEAYYEKYGAK